MLFNHEWLLLSLKSSCSYCYSIQIRYSVLKENFQYTFGTIIYKTFERMLFKKCFLVVVKNLKTTCQESQNE